MKRMMSIFIVILLMGAIFTNAQTPTFIESGKRFYIQSAMNFGKDNGGYWDVPGRFPNGAAIQRGLNIQIFDLDNDHDRIFQLWAASDGYYNIGVGDGANSRIDIQGRETKNGANVHVWSRTENTNQQFLFHHLGRGRFKIYDRNSGKILCLAGRSNANRTNVHIWNDHDGPSVEWYLIDVETKRAFVPIAPADFASWIASNNTQMIDNYLSAVSAHQLQNDDKGSIRTAMNSLDASGQTNLVVSLMNSVVKNGDRGTRELLYTQLEGVEYKRIPFLVRAIMTAHFNNFRESDTRLRDKVNAIQQKMNSAK